MRLFEILRHAIQGCVDVLLVHEPHDISKDFLIYVNNLVYSHWQNIIVCLLLPGYIFLPEFLFIKLHFQLCIFSSYIDYWPHNARAVVVSAPSVALTVVETIHKVVLIAVTIHVKILLVASALLLLLHRKAV